MTRGFTLRNLLFTLALFGAVGVGAYAYYYRPLPCTQPITYKIGQVDTGFGVNAAEFQADIAQAADVWSKAYGKPLFAYDPNGEVTINLVYDDRQRITQQEQVINADSAAAKTSANSVRSELDAAQASYKSAKNAYDADLQSFNQAQSSYNSEVSYWNGRGGAPAGEYQKLQSERNALLTQESRVESERQNVNTLAAQANSLVTEYNSLVGHINSNARTINNDGLAGTEFEEGVYILDDQGERINIYQFDNQTTFIRVLAHELGHALGLEHDTGMSSIMNPVNQGKTLALSSEDLASLNTLCKPSAI